LHHAASDTAIHATKMVGGEEGLQGCGMEQSRVPGDFVEDRGATWSLAEDEGIEVEGSGSCPGTPLLMHTVKEIHC